MIMNAMVIDRDISLNISKSEIGSENVNTIDARELHKTVKSKREFSTWIKSRISKYDFEEGVDFDKIVKPHNNAVDYRLTLDTAKEIAMVENNEEGRKIRRYLIEVEKKWRVGESKTKLDYDNPKELLGEAISLAIKAGLKFHDKEDAFKMYVDKSIAQIQRQEYEIKELKANNGKYKALQSNIASLATVEVFMSVEEAGVKLGIPRNRLFMKMRNKRLLKTDNSPYKRYDGTHFVQRKVKKGKNSTQYLQTFVMPKGLELLEEKFA